jgi:hypothetical protein
MNGIKKGRQRGGKWTKKLKKKVDLVRKPVVRKELKKRILSETVYKVDRMKWT